MPTDRQWAEARKAWQDDDRSFPSLAKTLKVATSTVSRRARRAGWKRNGAAQKREAQTRTATTAAIRRWADSRPAEADAAGQAGALMRAAATRMVADAMDQTVPVAQRPPLDARAVRELAIAYGIFLDKAQVLSGDATHRFEDISDPEVRRARITGMIDDLEERRQRKIAGGT